MIIIEKSDVGTEINIGNYTIMYVTNDAGFYAIISENAHSGNFVEAALTSTAVKP